MTKVAETIGEDDAWQDTVGRSLKLQDWLRPGPTSDWTPELSDEIVAAMQEDGIDIASMSDRQTVEAVSRWLLQRAEYEDGFSTFITALEKPVTILQMQ